jgi:ABC-type lipoprotein export system ATPase subunit
VTEPLVRCEGAARSFGEGGSATVALQATDCEVFAGDRIALVGPSGSGKSTLLHLMAGLDDPTVGSVTWPAIGPRAALRPGPVALIFQGPSLLPPLTVLENTALPLILDGRPELESRERAAVALTRLGLVELSDKLPDEISGGQAQRAAAARVLARRPRLVLADEPTGQLDRASGAEVITALLAASEETGAALVVATHDPTVAERLSQRWEMHSGRLATATGEPASSR